MNTEIEAAEFYVAGGTLRPGSPSYVERPADDELFNLALAGEFCYVLTARQMGKSSLMIRTARRLRAQDVYSVILDLTKIGTDVSVEQWYLGLLTQLKRNLKLSVDLEAWW
ncbi:MAG TPA: AAA-like domain-containing protein, partial [Anaerolineae bacterium]